MSEPTKVIFRKECGVWDSCKGQNGITCYGCNGHDILNWDEFENSEEQLFDNYSYFKKELENAKLKYVKFMFKKNGLSIGDKLYFKNDENLNYEIDSFDMICNNLVCARVVITNSTLYDVFTITLYKCKQARERYQEYVKEN